MDLDKSAKALDFTQLARVPVSFEVYVTPRSADSTELGQRLCWLYPAHIVYAKVTLAPISCIHSVSQGHPGIKSLQGSACRNMIWIHLYPSASCLFFAVSQHSVWLRPWPFLACSFSQGPEAAVLIIPKAHTERAGCHPHQSWGHSCHANRSLPVPLPAFCFSIHLSLSPQIFHLEGMLMKGPGLIFAGGLSGLSILGSPTWLAWIGPR